MFMEFFENFIKTAYGEKTDDGRRFKKSEEISRSFMETPAYEVLFEKLGLTSGKRGRNGAIQPNMKFPDMKAMADDIHALGLKLGIYSTPWIGTYAGHIGCYAETPEGSKISYDYVAKFAPVVEQQFLKGGYRLAKLLNEIYK